MNPLEVILRLLVSVQLMYISRLEVWAQGTKQVFIPQAYAMKIISYQTTYCTNIRIRIDADKSRDIL